MALNTAPNSTNPIVAKKGKEDKIELAFKAKRANIFTQGVDLERQAFSIRHTQKNEQHTKLICKFNIFLHFGLVLLIFLFSKCYFTKLYFCFVKW
jgi:hypothetical protein